MKLLKINSQYRRDFYGDYECEFCGHTKKDHPGYDDRNFHDNVVPEWKCDKCLKSTLSEGGDIQQVPTKYPEGFQI